jgi:hypothetical protein
VLAPPGRSSAWSWSSRPSSVERAKPFSARPTRLSVEQDAPADETHRSVGVSPPGSACSTADHRPSTRHRAVARYSAQRNRCRGNAQRASGAGSWVGPRGRAWVTRAAPPRAGGAPAVSEGLRSMPTHDGLSAIARERRSEPHAGAFARRKDRNPDWTLAATRSTARRSGATRTSSANLHVAMRPWESLLALDRLGGRPGFIAEDQRLLEAFATSAASASPPPRRSPQSAAPSAWRPPTRRVSRRGLPTRR